MPTLFDPALLAFARKAPADEDDDRQAMIEAANALLDAIDLYIGGDEKPESYTLGMALMTYKDEVRDLIEYAEDRLDPKPSQCCCAEVFHRRQNEGCKSWGEIE